MPVTVFGTWTTGAVLTGYALWLGAGPVELGLLSSAPLFVQVFTPVLIGLFTRRAHRPAQLILFALLSRIVWLASLVLPGAPPGLRLPLLTALLAWSWVFSSGVSNLLTALLGETLPRKQLGRFFSLRNALLGLVGTGSTLIAGVLLDHVPAPLGFQSLLLAATLAGLGAVTLLKRYPRPADEADSGSGTVGWTAPLRDPVYQPVLVYAAYWFFSASLWAPFAIPFFLKALNMSFSQISLWSALVALTALFFGPLWGQLADRVGNKPVLVLVTLLASTVLPLTLLLATPAQLEWVWVSAFFEGMVTSALGFGLLNLVLLTTATCTRSAALALFSASTGVAGVLGSVLAGPLFTAFAASALLEAWPGHWTPYHAVLLTSAALRLPTLLLLRRVPEVDAWPVRRVVLTWIFRR